MPEKPKLLRNLEIKSSKPELTAKREANLFLHIQSYLHMPEYANVIAVDKDGFINEINESSFVATAGAVILSEGRVMMLYQDGTTLLPTELAHAEYLVEQAHINAEHESTILVDSADFYKSKALHLILDRMHGVVLRDDIDTQRRYMIASPKKEPQMNVLRTVLDHLNKKSN